MLDIVAFKWSTPGYRSNYTADNVHRMASMIARHYPGPHRFTCITDDATGIDQSRVRVLRLWDTFKDLPSPHGGNNPSCFRRLRLWSDEVRPYFPGKILQIDLDMVLVGDVSSLWDRPEPCVLWADNLNPTSPYNGAMQLITPGAHQVWERFSADPGTAIRTARARGFFGSDQAQLALWLGPDMPRWRAADGAVSWRVHCRQTPSGQAHMKWQPGCKSDLPIGAKVVNFHGLDDPGELVGRVPWITENYQ